MAVAFVAHAYSSMANFAATKTISRPTGAQSGDLLIASLRAPNAAVTAPAGWTLWQNPSGTAGELYIFTKVAGASEPVSYTFNSTSSSAAWGGYILAYRGAALDTASSWASSSSGPFTVPAITVQAGGIAGTLIFNNSTNGNTYTGPSGWTKRIDHPGGVGSTPTYYESAVADISSANGGTYGGGSAQWSSPDGAWFSWFSFSLKQSNDPPNAPTVTAPADGATIDRNSTQRFDWDFSDPDVGDTQSKYDLRYRAVGAGTWTDVTGTTPNTYHDFAGGTFTAGDHEWQARTYDAQGAQGPYSSSSFFTAANAPEEPTITDPINGATVGSSHTVAWSTPDQDGYQIRRVADNAGSPDGTTVYYDSGEVVTATARSHTLTFETNNRYEHIQVRQKRGGLWSQWASVRVQVAYTPPPTPIVSLLADTDAGSLVVTVTNPAPGAGEPAVNYNDIYVNDGDGEFRAATLVVPNSSWTYWLPRAQHDYAGNVRVVAVADNGVTASS